MYKKQRTDLVERANRVSVTCDADVFLVVGKDSQFVVYNSFDLSDPLPARLNRSTYLQSLGPSTFTTPDLPLRYDRESAAKSAPSHASSSAAEAANGLAKDHFTHSGTLLRGQLKDKREPAILIGQFTGQHKEPHLPHSAIPRRESSREPSRDIPIDSSNARRGPLRKFGDKPVMPKAAATLVSPRQPSKQPAGQLQRSSNERIQLGTSLQRPLWGCSEGSDRKRPINLEQGPTQRRQTDMALTGYGYRHHALARQDSRKPEAIPKSELPVNQPNHRSDEVRLAHVSPYGDNIPPRFPGPETLSLPQERTDIPPHIPLSGKPGNAVNEARGVVQSAIALNPTSGPQPEPLRKLSSFLGCQPQEVVEEQYDSSVPSLRRRYERLAIPPKQEKLKSQPMSLQTGPVAMTIDLTDIDGSNTSTEPNAQPSPRTPRTAHRQSPKSVTSVPNITTRAEVSHDGISELCIVNVDQPSGQRNWRGEAQATGAQDIPIETLKSTHDLMTDSSNTASAAEILQSESPPELPVSITSAERSTFNGTLSPGMVQVDPYTFISIADD